MLNVVIFIRWTSVWLIIPITTHRFQRLGRTLVIILARLVFSATFSSIWINASGTVTALFWGGPKDRTSPTEKTSVATSSSIFLGFFFVQRRAYQWISLDFDPWFCKVCQLLVADFDGFCRYFLPQNVDVLTAWIPIHWSSLGTGRFFIWVPNGASTVMLSPLNVNSDGKGNG